MKIENVLAELDSLYDNHQIEKVSPFLEDKIREAKDEGDRNALITLLNEIIGRYRETSEYDKALDYCGQLMNIMEDAGMRGTIPYATSLLNIANVYRAAGKLQESGRFYHTVRNIYETNLPYNDFRYASLYNNMSLLFQEKGDFESACDCLQRALGIATQYENARIEVAITYTNLAMSQMKLNRYEEAIQNLERAFAIFDRDEDKDYHYSGALSAMGEAQFLAGNLEESARYYKMALEEIEKNTGKNQAYEITLQNLNVVMARIENRALVAVDSSMKGLDLSEAFYREYGIPMIREQFPAYEKFIAAGLVGEGSECFGFDDEISRDHDFGPGFCLWLTDQVYDEIGEKLQEAYDRLPKTYMGITRYVTPKAAKRVGVFRIGDFYDNLIGLRDVPTTRSQWLFLDDYRLAAAVNGRVFRDDLGEFTRIRKGILAYYPEEVRLRKIARQAALMAQTGQYNYARMLQRGDLVTAHIALSEFMKETMQMIYLLNRVYAPFYKWMRKGMEKLIQLGDIGNLLDQLGSLPVGEEQIIHLIEMIVALVIAEMKKQGLTSGEDTYLDHHTDNILKGIPQKEEDTSLRKQLISEIVTKEWEAFDKVENEGGRASCQDDFNTFSIMRTSQYYTWTLEMLNRYLEDFKKTYENGWNMITEKYARMMKSTAPEQYALIKDKLPEISEDKEKIIEEIVKIQVAWMEDFAERYPKAAGNARSIHTYEDREYNTSYETYLRGEISTYSDEMLELYGRFIAQLCKEEKNLAEMTMMNSALLYGYKSLDDLEERL